MARSALIVAGWTYADSKLRRLRSPAHDAEQLAAVLADPQIGAFDVAVSVNEPEYAIRRKLARFFGDRARDDLLLLHFSCHGLKDEDGQLYFAAADTELEQLEATAVSAEFVNRLMSRSLSRRIVLLLDCCYAGAFGRGAAPRAGSGVELKERFDGRGRVVLTASTAMEYSFEGEELTGRATPSIFTRAVVEGLRSGAADTDGDGHVSVDDLYEHVYRRVRETTPNQTPSKWTYEVQGDLFVARSPLGPVVKPAELSKMRSSEPAPTAGTATVAEAPIMQSFGALALRSWRSVGPLNTALVFATAGLVCFLRTRGTYFESELSNSPLNRLGTLTIGAAALVAGALAAVKPTLRAAVATFVVGLALQEAVGTGAFIVITSRDGFGSDKHPLVGAVVAMTLAAGTAAVTMRNLRRRQPLAPSRYVALLLAVVAAATAFAPLFLSVLSKDGEELFYLYPWYRIEPIGLAAACILGVLFAYGATSRIAAGWLAATATNALLYTAGVITFAGETTVEGSTRAGTAALVLFGTAGLLCAAAAILLRTSVGMTVQSVVSPNIWRFFRFYPQRPKA